jgi:hypothetical protein
VVVAEVTAEEDREHDERDDPERNADGHDPLLVDLDRRWIRTSWLIRHGSTIGSPRSGRLAASTSGRGASGQRGGSA